MKHFILGKDAALEDSIDAMQQQLLHIGFHIEEHSWLNPIPNVWSVHIRDRDCPMLFTNGKGASKKAALASALGEFFERLNCNYFFADFYLGKTIANDEFVHYPNEKWFTADSRAKTELLSSDLWSFYDPDNVLQAQDLVDTNSGNIERGVCALPYQCQRNGNTVYFPVNIIGNLYVSNGMSAGNTPEEARVQALSEIFERWVKFKVIADAICLPDIPESVLSRYPSIQEGIRKLEACGYKVLTKDASLGGLYPVINVTLLNPEDQGCFASFGAHPRFEVALERTLTELLQGRSLDQLTGFSEPSFDLEDIAHPHNLETHFIDSSGVMSWKFLADTPDYDFADWDFEGTTEEEFKFLCQRIHDEDNDIFIADYQHLGMYGCRIIVPSMSDIYPPEDLEWDNNNVGIAFRESIFKLPELDVDALQNVLNNLQEEGFDDQHPVSALLGFVPDQDTLWQDLRVGELKTLIALAIEDYETALQGCEWISNFRQLNADRVQVYRCVAVLIQLQDIEAYRENISHLFGVTVLQQAEKLLSGEGRFWGVGCIDSNLSNFKMHQRLLEAYEKLQHAKRLNDSST